MTSNFTVQELSWSEVREEVRQVNTELASICDQLYASQRYPVLKISYPYGALVISDGVFCLPDEAGKVVPITSHHIASSFKEQLAYSAIPLSLVLTKSNEVFVEADHRIIPLNFFTPGDLFGLFETVNALTSDGAVEAPTWNVSAGARSTFMIPKITDSISHNKLKREYSINTEVPKNHFDQWQVFKELANKANDLKPWYSTILVFTSGWFESSDDTNLSKLHNYLIKQAWLQIKLVKDFTAYSKLWLTFTHQVNNLNLKPRGYLIDTVKHLMSIATGRGVGFIPATDELTLPRQLIQSAYIESYNLKDYIPTLMRPIKMLLDCKEPIYYSLSLPTLLESSPYCKNPPSVIEDQRDLKRLLDVLLQTIQQSQESSLSTVNFDLFHTGEDPYGQIRSSKIIPLEDQRFLASSSNAGKVFCATSTFFIGCIKISWQASS